MTTMELPVQPFRNLYIHVPFCRGKCGYCVFYSIPGSGEDLRSAYLERLASLFASVVTDCDPLHSVYIGGGTPSVLLPGELRRLLQAVVRSFCFEADCEWTVECNPETLDEARVAVLAQAGVNRVSLGVQTLNERHRATLQRGGSAADASRAVGFLRRGGIPNISCDLIYGIPGQTLDEWREDLAQVLDLGILHLSTYELTWEEGSRLSGGELRPVPEETALFMWDAVEAVSARYGLKRYEVSNLALPGWECRHNQAVWHGESYLGCGPAAASFDGRVRWTQVPDLTRWLQDEPPDADRLPPEDRAAEILAFGLRTAAGWEREQFRRATGFDCEAFRGAVIGALADEGFLVADTDRIRPTRRGLLFADLVAERLL